MLFSREKIRSSPPFFCSVNSPDVEIMSAQKISCEGCGSKWTFVGIGNQIVARLVECPLFSEDRLE